MKSTASQRVQVIAGLTKENKQLVNTVAAMFKANGAKFTKSDVLVHGGYIVRLSTSNSLAGMMGKILSELKEFFGPGSRLINKAKLDSNTYYWGLECGENDTSLYAVYVDELFGTIYFQF